jgi:hypothetical protein
MYPMKWKKEKARAVKTVRDRDRRDILEMAILENPRFRASIRRARRNRSAGKAVPLSKVRQILGA